jgi:hypothetical protein
MRRGRIETKPKRVFIVLLADGRFPVKHGIDISLFEKNIQIVRDCIVQGKALPNDFYRKGPGRDYLLEERGWLHLHVGYGIDDNVILIVEEHADRVIFIALTDHAIFEERPRARSLRGLGSKIAGLRTKR